MACGSCTRSEELFEKDVLYYKSSVMFAGDTLWTHYIMSKVVDSLQKNIRCVTNYEASEDRGVISIKHHTYWKQRGTLYAKQEFDNYAFAPFLSYDIDTAIVWKSPFHPQRQRFVGTKDIIVDNKTYHVNMFEQQIFIFDEGIAFVVPQLYYSYIDSDFNLVYTVTPSPEFALSYHIIDDRVLFLEREISLTHKKCVPQKIRKAFNRCLKNSNLDYSLHEGIEDILPV